MAYSFDNKKIIDWSRRELVAQLTESSLREVVVGPEGRSSGLADMHPISEAYPLSQTRHWIAGHRLEGDLGDAANPMQAFYSRLGMVLLGTIVDNDCGLDVMCMMLQLPQTSEQRGELRIGISDYLLERIEYPWMHDLMTALCELDADDVRSSRNCGLLAHAQPPIVIQELSLIHI